MYQIDPLEGCQASFTIGPIHKTKTTKIILIVAYRTALTFFHKWARNPTRFYMSCPCRNYFSFVSLVICKAPIFVQSNSREVWELVSSHTPTQTVKEMILMTFGGTKLIRSCPSLIQFMICFVLLIQIGQPFIWYMKYIYYFICRVLHWGQLCLLQAFLYFFSDFI